MARLGTAQPSRSRLRDRPRELKGKKKPLAGTNVGLWQEYALFFTLPMSFVGFPIGSWVGRDGPSPTAAGVIG
jgi:hypothetical protein